MYTVTITKDTYYDKYTYHNNTYIYIQTMINTTISAKLFKWYYSCTHIVQCTADPYNSI